MARTSFSSPVDGDQAVASHVTQFVSPIHGLEDFRDGAAAAGGNINLGSNKAVNMATPTANTDGANKSYVDSHPQLPSTGEKSALAGTEGAPGVANRYITETDRKISTGGIRFRDDFLGNKSPSWTLSGTGGTYTQGADLGGIGTLATGASTNNVAELSFGGGHCVDEPASPRLFVKFALGQTADCKVQLGLYFDADNLIEFIYDSAAASNWKVRCRDAGSETITDTGQAADTDAHHVIIDVDGGSVEFSTSEAGPWTISTNLTEEMMEPRVRIETLAAADKTLVLDLVDLLADRD